ncbi:VOC family protein [Clostridium sp. AM58-1XD]|uniref:VOC family protein n=1 Tax=Clostridium sp. AM58-1XD TaxID=2292307 RepID=UPI000E4CFEEE|nr:VOC family protein [Clostridium sp. AM58-1XD]RGY98532.1 VOC family protein [Clostridium sp. AM58-1XD]
MQTEKPTFTFQHVGVNCDDREAALKTVSLLSGLFGLEARTEKKGSPFAGASIEAMAGKGPGTHGHLAFYTPDMNQAIHYFETIGVDINYESAKRNENGDIYVIYLKQEIAGFAIQLINK